MTRSHLHRWLIEEEDKLERDREPLAEVEEAIKNFDEPIGAQMKIVAALEREGGTIVSHAKGLCSMV